MPNTESADWLAMANEATDLIRFTNVGVGTCNECRRISNLYESSNNIIETDTEVCAHVACGQCQYTNVGKFHNLIPMSVDDPLYSKLLMSQALLQAQAVQDFNKAVKCSVCYQLEIPDDDEWRFEICAIILDTGYVESHYIHHRCVRRTSTCAGDCTGLLPVSSFSWQYSVFYGFNDHAGRIYQYPSTEQIDSDTFCIYCFEKERDTNDDVACCERCDGWTYEIKSWNGRAYCESCYDNVIYYCDSCDDYYHCDIGHDCPDDDDDDSNDIIHNYSYKPAPEMFGQGQYYLGFELEVECGSRGSNKYDTAEKVQSILGHRAYMKEDGSLEEGFEVVTHPHTLEAYNKDFQWRFLNELQNMGYKSWNTSTCGLHVHVSRTAFDPVYDNRTAVSRKQVVLARQAHELRFMKLIYDNQRQVERIAGRSSSYSSFDDKGSLVPKVKYGEQNNGRYAAVNTENHATLEVRVFKGSLKETRVRSALEFVHAAVEYTRNLKVNAKNNALAWSKFVAYVVANEDTYPNLMSIINRTFNNENLSD